MRQTRCRQIDSRAGQYPVLDRNVVQMVVSYIRCRFDFYQAPTLISTPLQYVNSDENSSMLERSFEDGRDFWVFN